MLQKLPKLASQENINNLLANKEVIDLAQQSYEKNYMTLNRPTGDFFYDSWQIDPRFKNTDFELILSQLEAPGEARVIALPPGKAYRSHADIDDRYHLTLVAEKSYLVDLEQHQMYKTEVDQHWYLMNTGIIHSAVNFGSITRLQLVVRKLLDKNTIDNNVKVFLQPSNKGKKEKLRYIFDKTLSPWLNKAHKQNLVGSVSVTNQNTNIKFLINKNSLVELKSILPIEIEAKIYD